MRHAAITRFSRAVQDDAATVHRYPGHLGVQMVRRYTDPPDEHISEALEGIGTADSAGVVVGFAEAQKAERS